MEDKVNYTLVGAFVLVLGAALVAGVLWLAAGLSGQKRFDPYQSIIPESVAGLNIDAPVKYLGVDVGKVSKIGIDPQNPRQVRLLFEIERGTPLTQDSEAVLKTQGLTGIAYVELSGGSVGSLPLVATAEVPVPMILSKPSLSARLENVLTTVLASLDRTSANLNAVLDADNRASLKATLADTASLVHGLAEQQGTIAAGIASATRAAGTLDRASGQLAHAIQQLAASARALQAMADNVSQASSAALRTVDAAGGSVRQLSTEVLPETQRLLAEANQLAASLRHVSEQIDREPSVLLLGAPTRPAGPGEGARP